MHEYELGPALPTDPWLMRRCLVVAVLVLAPLLISSDGFPPRSLPAPPINLLIGLPLLSAATVGVGWVLTQVRVHVGHDTLRRMWRGRVLETMRYADVTSIMLFKRGRNGWDLILVGAGRPGFTPRLRVPSLTSDGLGPLLTRLDQEVAQRPWILAERYRRHWESYPRGGPVWTR